MALSGLLWERAMIRIAFQSSPIRNLPLSESVDLVVLIFATVTRNSMHLCNRGTTVSPSSAHPLYRQPYWRAGVQPSELGTRKMLPRSTRSESGKNSLTNLSLHRSGEDSKASPPIRLRRRALDNTARQNEFTAVQGPSYHKPSACRKLNAIWPPLSWRRYRRTPCGNFKPSLVCGECQWVISKGVAASCTSSARLALKKQHSLSSNRLYPLTKR
jgi:hypothetical protein